VGGLTKLGDVTQVSAIAMEQYEDFVKLGFLSRKI